MRLNEILDTISRAIALTANLPISFGRRREPKASLADDECPLLPSEDVDRIILPRGDGLQERYEVVGGVASLTIEPEPASAPAPTPEQAAAMQRDLQAIVDRINNGRILLDFSDRALVFEDLRRWDRQLRQPYGIWRHTAQCCLNCAYFVPGKTLCCNAFHTIEDSTAINDCADFELK